MPPKATKRRMATVRKTARRGKHPGQKRTKTVAEWRDSWLRLYKVIACVAVFCVILPALGFVSLFGGSKGQFWVADACLFAVGYLIHWSLRRLFVHERQEMSFNFETKWAKSPPLVFVSALLLSLGAGVLAGYGLGRLILLATDEEAVKAYISPMAVCTVSALVGCVLVPAQFHQLCSLRTMLECLSVMAFPIGFQLAGMHYVNTQSAVSVLLYALCLMILMNQEYIIRPSYSNPTCYAPRRMRLRGLGQAVGFWLETVGVTVLIVGLLSLLVTPVRYLFHTSVADIFGFPFDRALVPGAVPINGILFCIGALELPAVSLLFILRIVRRSAFMRMKQTLAQWRERFVKWLKWIASGQWRRRVDYGDLTPVTVGETPKRSHYVDTVTRMKQADNAYLRPDRHAFAHNLKALPDTDARFRYAYEVLITDLADAHIGVSRAQTPLEAAAVVAGKTNIREIDALTATYAAVVYGRDCHADEAALSLVYRIVEERLSQ